VAVHRRGFSIALSDKPIHRSCAQGTSRAPRSGCSDTGWSVPHTSTTPTSPLAAPGDRRFASGRHGSQIGRRNRGSCKGVWALSSQVGSGPPDRSPSRSRRSRQASSPLTSLPRRRRGRRTCFTAGGATCYSHEGPSGGRARGATAIRVGVLVVRRVGSRVHAKLGGRRARGLT
jgi:hypothetical protein